jgi:hypothetical protein
MESDFITDPAEPALADVDDDTLYADGDTLGKVWAFINQVGDRFFLCYSVVRHVRRIGLHPASWALGDTDMAPHQMRG